jgi:hypothetical protein
MYILICLLCEGLFITTASVMMLTSLNEQTWDVAVDHSGNSYTCGCLVTPPASRGSFLRHHSNTGNISWTLELPVASSSENCLHSIFIKEHHLEISIYVTGYRLRVDRIMDVIVAKINGEGILEWLEYYSSTTKNNEGHGIAVDAEGNVYVAGLSQEMEDMTLHDDMLLVKFDPGGNLAWSRRFDSKNHKEDQAFDVVVDHHGHLVLVGHTFGAMMTNGKHSTINLNSYAIEQILYSIMRGILWCFA